MPKSSANLIYVPVAEFSWYLNLMSIFIHGEVEVSAEPLNLHRVPVLVIEQTSKRNKKLTPRGGTHTWKQRCKQLRWTPTITGHSTHWCCLLVSCWLFYLKITDRLIVVSTNTANDTIFEFNMRTFSNVFVMNPCNHLQDLIQIAAGANLFTPLHPMDSSAFKTLSKRWWQCEIKFILSSSWLIDEWNDSI